MRNAVRLIVGFSRGSASDDIANTIAAALARELGRAVNIELHPGNNGADAARKVAASPADGDTLFVATLGTHGLAPHLDENLPYDPLQDFAPVSLLTQSPLVLACHRSLGVDTVPELVALAHERPGELTYGTSALGGAPHLAAELFCSLAGVRMKHVRYSQTDRLYDDLEAGRVDLTFNNVMSMLPRCANGSIVPLAVTTADRSAAAPYLPTIAESGLPQYEVSNWLGIVAPHATPRHVVDQTRDAIAAALEYDGVASTLNAAGVTPAGGTPEEFAAFIAHELARWKPVGAVLRASAASAALPHLERSQP
jgi:tripartite-type tricarboxylate transporter receptor subunit TctC